MIIAVTGHRPNKMGGFKLPNPIYTKVCQQLEKVLILTKPDKAITGMALGVDSWFAYICIRLHIPFLAAVPFEGQESRWPISSQNTYNKLISLASETVIVCEGSYAAYKMQVRNQFMVDSCDILIAVYNGDKIGGTANCVNYARSLNKKIIYINPTP
jgi:uncharacterized phage-like protein YoqJ